MYLIFVLMHCIIKCDFMCGLFLMNIQYFPYSTISKVFFLYSQMCSDFIVTVYKWKKKMLQ